MVGVALDGSTASACTLGYADRDRAVTIDEILLAIGHALEGGGGPS